MSSVMLTAVASNCEKQDKKGQATVVPTIRSTAEIYVTLSVELTRTEEKEV